MRQTRESRGVTMVETLAVGAVCVFLAAIVVPALNLAKEQARTRVCISNLRTIGQAAVAYADEYANLPWALPNPYSAGGKTYSWTYYTPYVWGGGMTDKSAEDWENSGMNDDLQGVGFDLADFNRVPPKHRPLNRYLSPAVYWSTQPQGRIRNAKELPAVFKCPSDRTALIPTVGADQPPASEFVQRKSWDWFGSSYPINFYWPYHYGGAGGFLTNLFTHGGDFLKRAQFRERAASQTVVFMESQLFYALRGARPPGYTGSGPWGSVPGNEIGWHGLLDHHVAAFLDGSARYQKFDTRFVIGKNWTIWPAKPWTGRWAPYNDVDP